MNTNKLTKLRIYNNFKSKFFVSKQMTNRRIQTFLDKLLRCKISLKKRSQCRYNRTIELTELAQKELQRLACTVSNPIYS